MQRNKFKSYYFSILDRPRVMDELSSKLHKNGNKINISLQIFFKNYMKYLEYDSLDLFKEITIHFNQCHQMTSESLASLSDGHLF